MKDALEQAFVMGRSMGKQGLVAWGVFEGNYLHDMFFTGEEAQELAELKGSHAKVRPLYDAPLQAAQEPVAIALNTGTKQGVKWLKNVEHGLPLYTTPQQQEPRNFCPRCGKRTEDIHTCTPPEGGHQ